MKERNTIQKILVRINLFLVGVLIPLQLSTLFYSYQKFWAYLPVFRYTLSDRELSYQHSVHSGEIHELKIGFYFQIIMLVFSLMIYAAKKRLIAFQIALASVIIHAVILLIEINTGMEKASALIDGQPNSYYINQFYILFFSIIMLLNYLFDTKKGSAREPYHINENTN